MPRRTISSEMETLTSIEDADVATAKGVKEVLTSDVLHRKILAAVARAQQVYFIDKVRRFLEASRIESPVRVLTGRAVHYGSS